MLCLGLILFLTPGPGHADEVRLLNVGVRGGVDGVNVFGGDEKEHFQQYDVFATATLPWGWYGESGWGLSSRLMGTAGVLLGAGEAGFVGALVPVLAFGPRDSPLSLDAGVGAAILTRTKFGVQDFGGALQVVLTFGLRVPVYRGFGVGYRMQHLSDAKIYDDGRGADLHMLELTYTFR
jgi:hypothetical protein